MQRRLTELSLFHLFFSYLHCKSSGVKTALLQVNSKATLPPEVPTLPTPRRLARISHSMVVDHRVVPCHLQVSGTRESCNIEASNLIRGQDRAPADNPLLSSSNNPLANLVCLTSRCSSLEAPAATVVAVPSSNSSGVNPLRATSTRTASADTRARLPSCSDFTCPALFKLFLRPA